MNRIDRRPVETQWNPPPTLDERIPDRAKSLLATLAIAGLTVLVLALI